REWILTVRRQIGIVELSDLIYVRSEYYHSRQAALEGTVRARGAEAEAPAGPDQSGDASAHPEGVLFGSAEGRIAWANRQRDPLLLFAALHRHLDYPEVPRAARADPEERLLPVLAR